MFQISSLFFELKLQEVNLQLQTETSDICIRADSGSDHRILQFTSDLSLPADSLLQLQASISSQNIS